MDHSRSSAGKLLSSFLSSYSRAPRLGDRIRKLCEDALTISEPAELKRVLGELKDALRDHTAKIRELAATRPAPSERRQSSSS